MLIELNHLPSLKIHLKIYLTRLLCIGKRYRFWDNPAQASIFEEISKKKLNSNINLLQYFDSYLIIRVLHVYAVPFLSFKIYSLFSFRLIFLMYVLNCIFSLNMAA